MKYFSVYGKIMEMERKDDNLILLMTHDTQLFIMHFTSFWVKWKTYFERDFTINKLSWNMDVSSRLATLLNSSDQLYNVPIIHLSSTNQNSYLKFLISNYSISEVVRIALLPCFKFLIVSQRYQFQTKWHFSILRSEWEPQVKLRS